MAGHTLPCMLSAFICLALSPGLQAAEGGAAAPASGAQLNCEMAAGDLTWIDGSIEAWHHTSRAILGIKKNRRTIATFYDDDCVLTGQSVPDGESGTAWSSQSHGGTVLLPDGNTMPAVVSSFAAPLGDDGSFFAMATPSVWRKEGVESALGLETLMTAVLIHEMSHTFQLSTYGRRISQIDKRLGLGDDLSDDTLQNLFESNPEYATQMGREIDLLYKAAAAPNNREAKKFGRAAIEIMETRRTKWLVGERKDYQELEDLFLTLEGAGQWAAYAWLSSEAGAGLDKDTTIREFGRRPRSWSQKEGLAMFLLLDRLLPTWKQHAFGDGKFTALEMLQAALTEP